MQELTKRKLSIVMAVMLSALLAFGIFGMPTKALAADNNIQVQGESKPISGVDFLEPTAEGWELLRADGLEGRTIYIDIAKTDMLGTTYLAKFQPYTIPNNDAADGEGVRIAQIIASSMKMPNGDEATPNDLLGDFSDRAAYDVTIHSSVRGGKILYSGTIYPVYAALSESDGTNSGYELLGIRTANNTEASTGKNLGVGESYYKLDTTQNGEDGQIHQVYALQRTQDGLDNRFDINNACYLVDYKRAEDASISGAIKYVDSTGKTVRTDDYANIGAEGKVVRITKSFVAENKYYRAVSTLAGTEVTLTPKQATHTIRVVEVPNMDQTSYSVTVNYKDETGKLLWSDSVDVKGYGYQYTLPNTFSMYKSTGVNYYTFQNVQKTQSGLKVSAQSDHQWGNPIEFTSLLQPEDFETDADGNRSLTAFYNSQNVDKRATFTIVEIDGSTGEQISSAIEQEITPSQRAEYYPSIRMIDGVNYVPWAGNAEPIIYNWDDLNRGIDLKQYVYYVSEDYVPQGSMTLQFSI